MKQETNNEMDLLLRRLGRRPDIPLSDGNGDVNHLDADELNAYAENVLPPTARARYTEHLAECARCRDLVVQLSSAAGVIPVVETAAAAEPSALKRFLASLFSPMVLRYAVPALGLILVAALGLFVFRQRENREASSIALNEKAPAPRISTNTAPAQGDTTSANGNLKESIVKPAKSSASPENERAASAGATSRDELAKNADQPITAAEPPAPKPTAASDERQQAGARKEAPESRVVQTPTETVTVEASADKIEEKKAPEVKPASSAPANARQGAFTMGGAAAGVAAARSKVQREDSAADKDKAKTESEAEAETKTVAGRRFRKQGDVWVDTAYNFSRNATTLARGSEQFRALVADEPEIKTIADQLDGEILVLWKGRPYRIK